MINIPEAGAAVPVGQQDVHVCSGKWASEGAAVGEGAGATLPVGHRNVFGGSGKRALACAAVGEGAKIGC